VPLSLGGSIRPSPNSTFAIRNSRFDAISSPGTPGTPWLLDNSSFLCESPPEFGGAQARQKGEKLRLALQSERGIYSASTREVLVTQDFSNGGSMPTFKRTQVRAPTQRLCARSTSRTARGTVMWRCMHFKDRANISMESRLQAVGAGANTMMLNIQRARNGGRLTG
jgi:hypothetical protein